MIERPAVQHVAITRVEMERAEGPSPLPPKATLTSWPQAARLAREWSATAPKGGGYDKVDVAVTWADGTQYAFRFDMTKDCAEGNTLGETMRSGIRFYSGQHCPSHMTLKRYRNFLDECVPTETQERFTQMLDGKHEGIER
jgi:hypothetical protein